MKVFCIKKDNWEKNPLNLYQNHFANSTITAVRKSNHNLFCLRGIIWFCAAAACLYFCPIEVNILRKIKAQLLPQLKKKKKRRLR